MNPFIIILGVPILSSILFKDPYEKSRMHRKELIVKSLEEIPKDVLGEILEYDSEYDHDLCYSKIMKHLKTNGNSLGFFGDDFPIRLGKHFSKKRLLMMILESM